MDQAKSKALSEIQFGRQLQFDKGRAEVTRVQIGKCKKAADGTTLPFLFSIPLDKAVKVSDVGRKCKIFEPATSPEPILPENPGTLAIAGQK
jgi:hypothetical protein